MAKRRNPVVENFSKQETVLVEMTNGKRTVSVKPMHVPAYEQLGYERKEILDADLQEIDSAVDGQP